ncbi:glycerophosphoryl diester phosphodiesterase [Pseudohyphozyma bogoriensis]|nr:glycerophosphoryl diester phosphodiesterase [Pseudohyphozyma bogoriensis]
MVARVHVHITKDDVIIMFHDPKLERTTNGAGNVHSQNYHGGIDQLRTTKLPAQKIPTFEETIALLMRPENSHVFLNIDVKPDNDPERLFNLMHTTISHYPSYETSLGPRLVLGLWHPKFIQPALTILPYIRLAHIGLSPALARKYFWDACSSFSMAFVCLAGKDGELFRKECRAAGKDLYVWTVNKREQMIEATHWGAFAILTDRTDDFLALRKEMDGGWSKMSAEFLLGYAAPWFLSKRGGPLPKVA